MTITFKKKIIKAKRIAFSSLIFVPQSGTRQIMTYGAITIPKKITKGEELLVVPRKAFEEFLRWQKRREWEEKNTDEAIRIFEKELKEGKLKHVKNFRSLLK